MRNKNLKIIFLMRILAVVILLFGFAVIGSDAFAEHPCLLFSSEDIPALKLKKDDATNSTLLGVSAQYIWQQIKAEADKYVNETITDKEDPQFNGKPGFVYKVEDPAWKYFFLYDDATNPCEPHLRNETTYPAWTGLSRFFEIRLVNLAFTYLITDDVKYAERAKQILLKLSQWTQWTDPELGGGLNKAYLDTGHFTRGVALAYDWLYGTLTDKEREQIEGALKDRGLAKINQFLTEKVQKFSDAAPNFLQVLGSSLGLGTLVLKEDNPGDPDLGSWFQKANQIITLDFDNEGKDGGTLEGPSYATYGLDAIALFFKALDRLNINNPLLGHATIVNLPRYATCLLTPQGKELRTFGDGGLLKGFPLIMHFLSTKDNAVGVGATYYLKRIGFVPADVGRSLDNIGNFLFLKTNINGGDVSAPSFNPSGIFQDIGYGVLRGNFDSDMPALYFKCGPPTKDINHNHFDHNSFVMYHQKQWIIDEPICRVYVVSNDEQKRASELKAAKYTIDTISHSSIVLDDRDFYEQYLNNPSYRFSPSSAAPFGGHEQTTKDKGKITHFFSSDIYDYIKGDATPTYDYQDVSLSKFFRNILYLKPDYFVTYDELTIPSARHYFSFLLHTKFSPKADREGLIFSSGSAGLYVKTFSPDFNSQEIISYPGLEQYGKILITRTTVTNQTSFASLLYPCRNPALIDNPDFEDGLVGWRTMNWDTVHHTIDDQEKHSGLKSAKITLGGSNNSGDQAGYFYSSRFVLPPGTEFTVQCFAKTAIEIGSTRLRFIYWKKDGTYLSDVVSPIKLTGTNDWTPLNLTATVPEVTAEIQIAFEFLAQDNHHPGKGTVWLDDLNVNSPQFNVTLPAVEGINGNGGKDGLLVTTDKGNDVILFNLQMETRTFSLGNEKVITDGEVAVIRRDNNGMLTSTVLQQGTMLKLNGVDLCTPLNERVTIATEYINGKPKYISAAKTISREDGINQPPILKPIGDKAINEGKKLTFTIEAQDYNGEDLTYSASGLPPGATFDATHAFSWIPTSQQSGNYAVTFTVSDGVLSNSEVVTIVVADTNQPAQPTGIIPTNGSSAVGQSVNITTIYNDPDGYQDISLAYLLINNTPDGNNCLYAYYNQNTNKLYLRDHNSTWIGGYAPESNYQLENDYVKLDCAQTTVLGSQTQLIIKWNITFKPNFCGKKNSYLYVADNTGAKSGWIQKGTWTIVNQPPSVGSIYPIGGQSLANKPVTLITTYNDPNGWVDIAQAYLLVNLTSNSYYNCCYAYYDQNTNKLYLSDDSGTKWLGGYPVGSKTAIQNSYCLLDCGLTTVSGSGTTLTVNWYIIFKSKFLGTKNTYLFVKDDAGAQAGWSQKGTWSIINQAPVVASIIPASGSSPASQAVDFTTTYSDANSWYDISKAYLIINTQLDNRNGFSAFYDKNTNILYLCNDNGTSWLSAPLGSTKVLENYYVKLNCASTTVTGSDANLIIKWNVIFKSTFKGTKNSYLKAIDSALADSGWKNKGTWTIN